MQVGARLDERIGHGGQIEPGLADLHARPLGSHEQGKAVVVRPHQPVEERAHAVSRLAAGIVGRGRSRRPALSNPQHSVVSFEHVVIAMTGGAPWRAHLGEHGRVAAQGKPLRHNRVALTADVANPIDAGGAARSRDSRCTSARSDRRRPSASASGCSPCGSRAGRSGCRRTPSAWHRHGTGCTCPRHAAGEPSSGDRGEDESSAANGTTCTWRPSGHVRHAAGGHARTSRIRELIDAERRIVAPHELRVGVAPRAPCGGFPARAPRGSLSPGSSLRRRARGSPPWQAAQPNPLARWISSAKRVTGALRRASGSAAWQALHVSGWSAAIGDFPTRARTSAPAPETWHRVSSGAPMLQRRRQVRHFLRGEPRPRPLRYEPVVPRAAATAAGDSSARPAKSGRARPERWHVRQPSPPPPDDPAPHSSRIQMPDRA